MISYRSIWWLGSMRTFSCFITVAGSSTPTLSFVLAENEARARELALRELMDVPDPVSMEICEGGKSLWVEAVEPTRPPPRRSSANLLGRRRRFHAWGGRSAHRSRPER